jgi:hypothetical protein
MKTEQRTLMLKIAAGAGAALWLLDMFVIEPAYHSWNDQSDRIAALRTEVDNGQKLIDRENALRQHWADMMHANLPEEVSAAEDEAFKAVARWAGASQITFTNLTKEWQTNDTYKTLDFRISANGDQASIGRFLYELESDSMPVSLEECEITTRDAHGSQLTLTAHFSFLRLPETENTR